MLQEAGHIKNTVVLIFRHIYCLHLMNSMVAWVLVSLGTQVQPQIMLDRDYFPDYFPFLMTIMSHSSCLLIHKKEEIKCSNILKQHKNTKKIKGYNPNCPRISDHPYGILMIGASGSRKKT